MAEPKKETVQISLSPGLEQAGPALSVAKREAIRIVLPTRTAGPPIRQVSAKITPLSAETATNTPSVLPQPVSAGITSALVDPVDAIPRPVCWTLLGLSTLIFLIQIWNYVVS